MDSLVGQHLPANWVTEITKSAKRVIENHRRPRRVFATIQRRTEHDATPAYSDFHAVVYHFDDMAVSLR